MAFTPVTREKAKLRMALTGVSGAGKTLGALYIAYGMTGDWNKVALIDTEHERAKFYANRTDLGIGTFLYQSMGAPFSPDKYKAMVKEGAQAVGPDGVVIVDSFSHVWNAEGGVLDIKEKLASSGAAGMNSYTAWNQAGKEQTSLVNSIFAVDCHTIVTMRSKMEYALETNEKGKQQPVKLGLAPVQRDDTEYEFDTVLTIDRSHIATASKDVTFLDKYGQIITPELGKEIAAWLNNGVEPEKCAQCGHTIIAANGKTVEQIIEGTVKCSGRKMCMDCFNAWYMLNRGRQAQMDKIYTDFKLPAEQHDDYMLAIIKQHEIQSGYPADATKEQFDEILKDMKGE